jgi:hypothetical protein
MTNMLKLSRSAITHLAVSKKCSQRPSIDADLRWPGECTEIKS